MKNGGAAPAALPAVVRSHQSHTYTGVPEIRQEPAALAARPWAARSGARGRSCCSAPPRGFAPVPPQGQVACRTQKCASCKSLLGAVQRRALDGWAREQLLSACATRPEQQVRRAPGGVMHAAVSVRTSPGSRVLTPRCAPAAEGRVLGRSGGGGGADARGIRSEPARGPVQQGALLASRGGGQGRHLVLPCALTHRARCRRVCARRPSCRISRRWFSTPSPAARSSARHAKLPRATQPQLCRTPPRRTRCARLPAPSSRRCGRRRRAPHAPGLPERPMR